MPGKQVELQLRDLMMEFHDSNLGANITRNGKRARGYPVPPYANRKATKKSSLTFAFPPAQRRPQRGVLLR